MNKITKILAEEIKDSRENPTIRVTVFAGEARPNMLGLASLTSASFSVPSGASTGFHEARELRDVDGKDVKSAIEKVDSVIAPALMGRDVLNQKEIDRIMIELDRTSNKNNLGSNSMIGVSIACAKVAAKIKNVEVFEYLRTLVKMKPSRQVPFLYMNLINGGKHVLQSPSNSLGASDKSLAFQEYHIVPEIEDVKEAVEMGITIQSTLKEIVLKDLGEESVTLGDEGGFAPKISDIRKPLLYLSEAIKRNNLQGKVRLALDVAASSFFENGMYKVDGKSISKEELLNIYNSLVKEFNLLSIEDPFFEEDFESFNKLKEGNKGLFVVGDDLTVTNKILLQKAIKEESINAMIIKPNQIGTLTETLETMKLARENNIELVVSHRSGETGDDFIADLAFAFGCFGLKAGAPVKPERMVKYKRLIKISGR